MSNGELAGSPYLVSYLKYYSEGSGGVQPTYLPGTSVADTNLLQNRGNHGNQ